MKKEAVLPKKKLAAVLASVILLTLFAAPFSSLHAEGEPLSVTTEVTAEQLAANLVGSGVTVTNPVLTQGSNISAGIFTGGMDSVGFSSGIILSTGNASAVVGTNSGANVSNISGGGSDPELVAISSGPIYDACVLTFDIIPSSSYFSFQYVLGSEEYEEYINMADIFGLFYAELDNEGNLVGSYQNFAWIPDVDPQTAVSIGTINQSSHPELYRSNFNVTTIPSTMDGFTTVLNASQAVTPGVSYRIKLAVGDIGDNAYDSNVFIKASSLSSQETAEPSPTPEVTAAPTLEPTAAPTLEPTAAPTLEPTAAPTLEPTAAPTTVPTAVPTSVPTSEPTAAPTQTPVPTATPTTAVVSAAVTKTGETSNLEIERIAVILMIAFAGVSIMLVLKKVRIRK